MIFGEEGSDPPNHRRGNEALRKKLRGALAALKRKEIALGLALENNVVAMQAVLRYKIESTPVGYYDALTESRAEVIRLLTLLDLVPHDDRCASVNGCWCNVCEEDHGADGRPVCEGFTHWLNKPCNCLKSKVNR